MAEATEEVEEEEEQECPKCPPPGAPAWMATFADMATLLMAFFVLILSFAEFNVPKFKQISGSLKNAFGVQRIVPVVEQPKGTTVLSLNFSPSPSPSVTKQMTQQTTTIEQPQLEQKQKDKDSDGGETDKKETNGGQLEADELAKALKEAIGRGDVSIESLGDKVFVNFNNTNEDDNKKDTAELIEETLKALEEARAASGKAEQEVLFGGIEQKLAELAASAKSNNQDDNGESNSDGEGSGSGSAEDQKAKIAEDNLQVALKQEIDKGLVEVERKDGKVFVTVGAGGAFPSGSAELTDEARTIMAKIATTGVGPSSKITVSGHTDNVPLKFGSNFRDNWDLAAARASSVVQEMEKVGTITADRMQAVSFGEAKPIKSNDTSEGRSKNRRIEIEIDF
ncbi:MAG: flagellar motor protein MotB [Paracoccaceae bacterium]